MTRLRVAAYQAPLAAARSFDAIGLIAQRLRDCEARQVSVLLCPEAILGGLADNAENPFAAALGVADGELAERLRPLASGRVTTIIGFTERDGDRLYNSAAIYASGEVRAIYRKQQPARRASVYSAGVETLVSDVGGVPSGIAICNDTNFPDLIERVAERGARILFVPSNNALPPLRADVVQETRDVDVANARRSRMAVVRADVAGEACGRISFGASAIISADGAVVRSARTRAEDLIVADIDLG